MTMPLAPVASPVVSLTPAVTSNTAAGTGAASAEQAGTGQPVFSAALTLALGQVAAVMQKAATGPTPETPSVAGEKLAGDGDSASADAPETLAQTLCAAHSAPGRILAQAEGNVGVAGENPELEGAVALPPHLNTDEPLELGADTATGIAVAIAATAGALTSAPVTAAPSPSATSPVEASGIRRSVDLLAPEFRERLERVIDRMESEFGYTVEVVETVRSQSRQDALYARGRTEGGRVVTWTRASNHTVGHAADVVIDGSYADALPYERLARIAREEGLRTLGARDPGHIELTPARSAFSSSSSSPNVGALPASDQPRTVIGRAAPSVAPLPSIVPTAAELQSRMPAVVAPVATVARVAQVAEVARVAQVGATALMPGASSPRTTKPIGTQSLGTQGRPSSRSTSKSGTAETPDTLAAPTTGSPIAPVPTTSAALSGAKPSAADAEALDAEPNAKHSREDRLTSATASATASEVLRQVRDDLMHAVAGTDPNTAASSRDASTSPVGGVAHTDMSERIARLLKVQDAAGDRPLSQVLLRLERPDGGEDRVRVDLRGSAISATLDVGDQAAADKLGANVKELQRALERHGFETEALTVRSATRSVESATIARAAGAAAESDLQRAAASSSPNNTSSRDRGARHDEQRPSPDSQRHRARRDQKGDR